MINIKTAQPSSNSLPNKATKKNPSSFAIAKCLLTAENMLVAWRLISQFHQRCIHEKIMADECVFANLTIDDFFSNVHMRIPVLRVKLHFILCNAEGKKVKKH